LVIILSGCAATYRPIDPPSLNYNSHDFQDGIGFSYKYDVLREKGNKKYAKKEDKKGIKLIAVKVTNNTDTVINIGRDAAFYSGQNQIFPMEPMAVKESIKQIVPGYLLYLLLTFLQLNVSSGDSGDSYPIGIIIGPGITIGNMAMAVTANKNMLTELYEYNILNKDIQKGETVYGIIGVRDMGFNPITIKIKK
nr:hypothetical protein [Bacteroidota bacterium]